jgi:hypothetical protein
MGGQLGDSIAGRFRSISRRLGYVGDFYGLLQDCDQAEHCSRIISMMHEEIEALLGTYSRWLKDKTVLKRIDDVWLEITTPYLDRRNDYLQIFVRKENDKFILTDDGYIINDLSNSGCTLDSPKRQELLKNALAGFGVQLDRQQLIVQAGNDDFSQKKHNLIQAMLSVNDLFYLASPFVASLFVEDVSKWLDLADIRYTPKVKLAGKSGYDHVFDFVIPKSREQSERIVQAISNPKKNAAEALVFKWLDTREIRSAESKLFAFLNDANANVSQSVVEALRIYDLAPVLWSRREDAREVLAS